MGFFSKSEGRPAATGDWLERAMFTGSDAQGTRFGWADANVQWVGYFIVTALSLNVLPELKKKPKKTPFFGPFASASFNNRFGLVFFMCFAYLAKLAFCLVLFLLCGISSSSPKGSFFLPRCSPIPTSVTSQSSCLNPHCQRAHSWFRAL
ncbi:hypothetical protein QBC35DRAFT_79423 [Podospora australis]|uniref:Uncharacterized protein n=1 Tax=Podospora australis TaxID=1536484 RepID=A0AAN6X1H2_9PEZI|nr:hypothetical protein QBC35DRAFT_79423 [Podospora australis]